jgi:hypothetical protein
LKGNGEIFLQFGVNNMIRHLFIIGPTPPLVFVFAKLVRVISKFRNVPKIGNRFQIQESSTLPNSGMFPKFRNVPEFGNAYFF